jgi:hypothetical protein
MADHRPWLKLWKTAYSDPALSRLSLEDLGRWLRLLLFVGLNGEGGSITLPEGLEHLSNTLRVRSAKAAREALGRLPGVAIKEADFLSSAVTVSFTKWKKYQVDDSSPRVQRWRDKRRSGNADPSLPVTEEQRYTEGQGNGAREDKTREESLTRRERGTNPRAQGTNPRALGTNPRAGDPSTNPEHLRLDIPDR